VIHGGTKWRFRAGEHTVVGDDDPINTSFERQLRILHDQSVLALT
jgi:hypothetical protein